MGKTIRWVFSLILMTGFSFRAFGYPWPLSSMNEQHRVSATFDECRGDRDHFHDGTDLPLGMGGNVYAVASGQVLWYDTAEPNGGIRVGRYAYVHVIPNPSLGIGVQVSQGDLIGVTNSQNHIHFKDGGGASGYPILNALREGALTPFEDPYDPNPSIIRFFVDGTNQEFVNDVVAGHVDIVAQASDITDLQSPVDMNNGVYRLGYEVFEVDSSTSVWGPIYPYQFDNWYSSSYITNVYAPGSNTSTYIYYVSNFVTYNSYWDASQYPPGNYVVAVYTEDIKGNADTTYKAVTVSEQDVLPPAQPVLKKIVGGTDNNFAIYWYPNSEPDLAGYRLYYSYDDQSWALRNDEGTLTDTTSEVSFSGFPNDTDIYFRLTAVDNAPIPNESLPSDAYGMRMRNMPDKLLIVDGFDRYGGSGSWELPYHSFGLSYGLGVDAGAFSFDTGANEAVTDGSLALSPYRAVIWFLGDDSTDDLVFDAAEKAAIQAYLENGGYMLVIGSEVGYDLGRAASTHYDPNFYHDYLKAQYVADRPGDESFIHVVEGLSGGIFDGLVFDFGDFYNGPYEEDWPDAISAYGGSMENLTYSGTNYRAGVQYEGTFGEGVEEGKLVYLGFAAVTVYPQQSLNTLIGRVLGFFGLGTGVEETRIVQPPSRFALAQNYPNPFNPGTTISYTLPRAGWVNLKIYNLLGEEVLSLVQQPQPAGEYRVFWNGRNKNGQPVGSGVYIYRLESNGVRLSHKCILVK